MSADPLEGSERAQFEEWCPIKILDPATAPKANTLVNAYWTAWQARAEQGRDALTKIFELADYRRTIRWMVENDFVMDESLETKRGKFVFCLYSALAEITEIATATLGVELPRCQCGTSNDCKEHDWRYDRG